MGCSSSPIAAPAASEASGERAAPAPSRRKRREWTPPDRLAMLAGMDGVRVRLTFPENLITEPVIGRMMRRFDVLPNIRRANIEDTVGWMVCEISGRRPTLEQA